MDIFTSQISIFLLIVLSATSIHSSVSSNHDMVRCNEKDRRTLSIFKQGIIDRFGRLSTWSTEQDCCAWRGVLCDNTTNRVTKIALCPFEEDKPLEGEINLSILELEFLNHLDLSNNNFHVINIPPIHHNLTRVSCLNYLDLSWNSQALRMDSLLWLSQHPSLKYLYLSGIDLHKETNWLQFVAMLPSLYEIHLNYCNMKYINPSLKHLNFTSLVTLDLSYNNFNSILPYWLFNISNHITTLYLSGNNIQGEIPSSLLNLQNLKYLHLSDNQFNGSIPYWIGQLEHLQALHLSGNQLCGSIPSTLGNLSSLSYLTIGSNNFSSTISETTFSKLSSLTFLDLSDSKLHFNPKWVPPFQLNSLFMANTNLRSNFPTWIYSQKSLQALDLSSSRISLADENRFWSFVSELSFLRLSNNSISGDISNFTLKSSYISLDQNNFRGGLPNLSPMATQLNFSHNSFSGSIPCGWHYLEYLEHVNLWNNSLSGDVLWPPSNLKALKSVNLGYNKFSGTIPVNMPENLQEIIFRANQFEGNIPTQLFNLSYLFHLDLAHNKLTGPIPKCVYNMTQMVEDYVSMYPIIVFLKDPCFEELFMKGQHYISRTDPHRRTIDFSTNKLSGEVPSSLFQLIQVQTMNLSHNYFSGEIPEVIGRMKNLESLDLSNNNFSGEIPQSMTMLYSLGYLNLSCNDFCGQIPLGTQLQSFNASSYIGNQELCGAPLQSCFIPGEYPKNAKQSRRNEDGDNFRDSLYLGMGVGFAVSFWCFCGSLFLVKKWRHTYYRFINQYILSID